MKADGGRAPRRWTQCHPIGSTVCSTDLRLARLRASVVRCVRSTRSIRRFSFLFRSSWRGCRGVHAEKGKASIDTLRTVENTGPPRRRVHWSCVSLPRVVLRVLRIRLIVLVNRGAPSSRPKRRTRGGQHGACACLLPFSRTLSLFFLLYILSRFFSSFAFRLAHVVVVFLFDDFLILCSFFSFSLLLCFLFFFHFVLLFFHHRSILSLIVHCAMWFHWTTLHTTIANDNVRDRISCEGIHEFSSCTQKV